MQVDEKPIIPEARDLDVNFVDDDDLQAVLARSRKAKLRKPHKLSPEEVAKKSKFSFALRIVTLLVDYTSDGDSFSCRTEGSNNERR